MGLLCIPLRLHELTLGLARMLQNTTFLIRVLGHIASFAELFVILGFQSNFRIPLLILLLN